MRKPSIVDVDENVNNSVEQEGEASAPSATPWEAFTQAGLVPKTIMCQGYLPVHGADFSCHTKLPLRAESLKNHLMGEHGGGFTIVLKPSSRVWPGWAELKEMGMEALDFRCEVCDSVFKLTAGNLLRHMKPHTSKNRRTEVGGEFHLTVTLPTLEKQAEDNLDEDGF